MLVEARAAVDARTHDGITPLYVALQHGQQDVARVLLAGGADANAQTATNNSVLHMLAQRGKVAEAALLIRHGCE